MAIELPKVGQVYRASQDVRLHGNSNITVLSAAAPQTLRKGSQAEITAVGGDYFDLNCNDGSVQGVHSWGLLLRVKKAVFGLNFEKV